MVPYTPCQSFAIDYQPSTRFSPYIMESHFFFPKHPSPPSTSNNKEYYSKSAGKSKALSHSQAACASAPCPQLTYGVSATRRHQTSDSCPVPETKQHLHINGWACEVQRRNCLLRDADEFLVNYSHKAIIPPCRKLLSVTDLRANFCHWVCINRSQEYEIVCMHTWLCACWPQTMTLHLHPNIYSLVHLHWVRTGVNSSSWCLKSYHPQGIQCSTG